MYLQLILVLFIVDIFKILTISIEYGFSKVFYVQHI